MIRWRASTAVRICWRSSQHKTEEEEEEEEAEAAAVAVGSPHRRQVASVDTGKLLRPAHTAVAVAAVLSVAARMRATAEWATGVTAVAAVAAVAEIAATVVAMDLGLLAMHTEHRRALAPEQGHSMAHT
jgi:hypothetical protein